MGDDGPWSVMIVAINPTVLTSVLDDPEVRARIKTLVLKSLDECEEYLTNGNSASKLSVMKLMIPLLIKSSKEAEVTDEMKLMRDELTSLMAEVRGSGTVGGIVTLLPAVAKDDPNTK